MDDGLRDAASLAAHAKQLRGGSLSRVCAIAAFAEAGIRAVPVAHVPELMEDGDFLADVLSVARDASGAFWPVLKTPYRLSRAPARIRAVPGNA